MGVQSSRIYLSQPIENNDKICYNKSAVDSFQQEGGATFGVFNLVYYLRYGRCGKLLHMQVVGRRRMTADPIGIISRK